LDAVYSLVACFNVLFMLPRYGVRLQRPIVDIMIINADDGPGRGGDVLDAQPMQAAVGLVLGGSYVQHLQVDSCTEEQQGAFVLRHPVVFFEDGREAHRLHVQLDQLYKALEV